MDRTRSGGNGMTPLQMHDEPKAAPSGEFTNRKPVANGEGPAGAAPDTDRSWPNVKGYKG